MAIRWITPQIFNIVGDGNFHDLDLSAYIPSSATGILYHKVGDGVSLYLRKNGSSDNYYSAAHFWGGIGVDASRIVEVKVSNGQTTDFYIVAYTESETVWLTNAVDKGALGGTGSYYDVDITSELVGGDVPLGVFVRVPSGNIPSHAIRCNGSTDDRYVANSSNVFFVGVDGSNLFEMKVSNTSCHPIILGYVKNTANLTVNINGSNYSLGSTGSYVDLAALPANSTGGFFEFWNGNTLNYTSAWRINGSSEDIYGNPVYKANAYVQCDANGIIEGKIQNLGVDTYLIAYTTTPQNLVSGYKSLKGVGI